MGFGGKTAEVRRRLFPPAVFSNNRRKNKNKKAPEKPDGRKGPPVSLQTSDGGQGGVTLSFLWTIMVYGRDKANYFALTTKARRTVNNLKFIWADLDRAF